MDKRQTFEIVFTHSSVLVHDVAVGQPTNRWTRATIDQGFAWRPMSVSFGTLFEGGRMATEVVLTDQLRIGGNAIRAIRVPFIVTASGKVNFTWHTGRVIDIPPGQYDLLYEAGGSSEEDQWCRFTFAPASAQPAAILRQDPDLNPPAQLVMDAEPA